MGQPEGSSQTRSQSGAEEQADGVPEGLHTEDHHPEGRPQAGHQQVGHTHTLLYNVSIRCVCKHNDSNTCSSCRFHSFLLFLGQPSSSIRDIKVTSFCRIIGEFALEYRTTRERVLTLKRKRATHRERTKTRGKMITEVKPPPTVLTN